MNITPTTDAPIPRTSELEAIARQTGRAALFEAIARTRSAAGAAAHHSPNQVVSVPARDRRLREAVLGSAEAGLGRAGWPGRRPDSAVASPSSPAKPLLASQNREGGTAI